MKLKNPFSNKTRLLFIHVHSCSKCGKNQSLELDHIYGRVSNSPLNVSVLCRKCHMGKVADGYLGKIVQLKKTSDFLKNNGYKITKKDKNFLISLKE